MRLSTILPIFGATLALGQSSTTTTTTASAAPTTSVVPASYNGKWRPQVHFSAPTQFINDPNGLFIDAQGIYHQYYQYNPYNTIAGNQTWGHATSTDLYHWTVQPIALAPTNGTDLVFSGSAVVDVNNTSGFFPNQTNGVVAIFTTAGPVQQVQSIAYSFDDGYTFVRYEGNPILSVDSNQFRDPKVIWHDESSQWIMVLSFATEFTVGIYSSANLKEWTFQSNFSYHGLIGYQYECPNMVQMPMEGSDTPMWLMYFSINPGAPLGGGSIGQYFPGEFNGTHFTAVDAVSRLSDFGMDNYATQFWYGIPGDQPQLSVGWASNWAYTNNVPTGPAEGWQSAYTLPRRNYLKNITRVGYTLVSEPYMLDTLLPSSALISNANFGNNTVSANFGLNGSGTVLLDVRVTDLNVSATAFAASINFTVSSSVSGESLSGGQQFADTQSFFMDRGNTRGFDSPFFVDKFATANLLGDTYHLQFVVDRSVAEAFINDGEKSGTIVFYPTERFDTINVTSAGLNPGANLNLTIWELESVWKSAENSSGVYNGNSTTQRRAYPVRLPI